MYRSLNVEGSRRCCPRKPFGHFYPTPQCASSEVPGIPARTYPKQGHSRDPSFGLWHHAPRTSIKPDRVPQARQPPSQEQDTSQEARKHRLSDVCRFSSCIIPSICFLATSTLLFSYKYIKKPYPHKTPNLSIFCTNREQWKGREAEQQGVKNNSTSGKVKNENNNALDIHTLHHHTTKPFPMKHRNIQRKLPFLGPNLRQSCPPGQHPRPPCPQTPGSAAAGARRCRSPPARPP